jgi:hypothetical protein
LAVCIAGVGVAMDTRGRDVLGSPLPPKTDGILVASPSSVSATELMLLRRGLGTLNAESLNLTAEACAGVLPAVPRTPNLRFT